MIRRYKLFVFLLIILGFGLQNTLAHQKHKRVVLENDGWKLNGDIVIPKSETKVPAVILLNKANGNRKVYERLAEQLEQKGIASLRLDLRGHGESINKGKFGPPFDEKMQSLIAGSDSDISAAFNYMKTKRDIDPNRIGLVGASYTGEEMAISARKTGYGKAYVALSPGSFSEESIDAVDLSNSAWFFIKAAEERAVTLKEFFAVLRQRSRTATTMEVAGNKHATDLLDSNPELSEIIAVWLKNRL